MDEFRRTGRRFAAIVVLAQKALSSQPTRCRAFRHCTEPWFVPVSMK